MEFSKSKLHPKNRPSHLERLILPQLKLAWFRLTVLGLILLFTACQSQEPSKTSISPTARVGEASQVTPTISLARAESTDKAAPPTTPTPTVTFTATAAPTSTSTHPPKPSPSASATATSAPPATPSPTVTPVPPTATPSPTSITSASAAQLDCSDLVVTSALPPVDGPVALRSDIQLRQVIETPGFFVRLDLDPLTNDLFYMDSEANIYRLNLQPGMNSKSSRVYTLADFGGAPYTLGMAFGPDGTLYIVGNDSQVDTTRAIIRKGVPNESGERVWSTLAATAPYPKSNTTFDHVFSGIVASPDGQNIYVTSGSRTDHGEVQANNGKFPGVREVPLTAAIFRIPMAGTDLVLVNDEAELQAQGYLFARGLRNAFDLAYAPNGDLFASENGPDSDYPEELNWIRQGYHYGFPWRMGNYDNRQQFPDYDPTQDPWLIPDSHAIEVGAYHNDLTFPPPAPALTFTEPIPNFGPDGDHFRDLEGCEHDASQLGLALGTFTSHRSPLGLTFDLKGTLSEEFRGDAFILSFGPAYEASLMDRGQDLLHLELTKAGDGYQMRATQLVRGFHFPIDSVLVNNKLYILEFGSEGFVGEGTGTIWEVTLP